MASFTNTPEQRRLLDAIASGESAYGGSGNYDVLYGGGRFSDFSDHPRQQIPIKSGPNVGRTSSAAGRYQFLAPTWDETKKELGLPDFSSGSQDQAAWHLAHKTYLQKTGRDLQQDIADGRTNDVASALSSVWTSIPGGIEPNNATGGFNQRLGGSPPANPMQTALAASQGPMAQAFTQQPQQPPQSAAPETFGERAGSFVADEGGGLQHSLQNAATWMMANDKPELLATLKKNNANEFSLVSGSDGSMYRLSKRDGTVTKVTGGKPLANQTPGNKAVDTAYAKDYAEWTAGGGYAGVEGQIGTLNKSINALRTETGLTGTIPGNTPDGVNAVINPRSVAVRENIEQVIQSSLRATLGAQFTEKEGERLIARAYNPRLSQEENAKRLEVLRDATLTMARAKQDAAEYFQSKGTLEGFKGRAPTLSDINSINFDNQGTNPSGGTGYKVLKVH